MQWIRHGLVLLNLLDDVCSLHTFAVVNQLGAFDEIVVTIGNERQILEINTCRDINKRAEKETAELFTEERNTWWIDLVQHFTVHSKVHTGAHKLVHAVEHCHGARLHMFPSPPQPVDGRGLKGGENGR